MSQDRALNTDVNAKGIERAALADAMLSAAGLDVLGALRTGIVCVLPDGTVSAVNDAAAEALAELATQTQVIFLTHHTHLLPIIERTIGRPVNVVRL